MSLLGPTEKSADEMIEKAGVEHSHSYAADWFAEAATRDYDKGNLDQESLIEILDQVVMFVKSDDNDLEAALDYDLREFEDMPEVSPVTPGRDRQRRVMREGLGNSELEGYDVIVSAGGSSLSFADEIADGVPVDDVAVALDRGADSEVEASNTYAVSYLLGGDSTIEIIGPDIEDRDVLMVTDYGTSEHDRDDVTQAVIDASSSYDQLEIGALTSDLEPQNYRD